MAPLRKNAYLDTCQMLLTFILTLTVMDTKVSTVRPCPGFNVTDDMQMSPQQSTYESPENVTISCKNISFALIGQPVRRCLSPGVWDSSLPFCQIIPCPLLITPTAGTLILEYKNTSLIAQFSCDITRILIGQQMITCMKDGSWSDGWPVCLVECGSAPSLDHALVFSNCSLPYCQSVYTCEEGYRLEGDDTRTCTANGTWSVDGAQLCTQITCSWPDFPVGNFTTSIPPSGRRFLYNTTLRYSCGPHAVLVGEGTLWCGPMGQWVGSPPECVKVSTPAAGSNTSGWSNYSTSFSPATSTSEAPSTTLGPPKHCPFPPELVHGTYKRHGHIVHYRCNTGYIMEGTNELRCRRNGTWAGTVPTCIGEIEEEPADEMLSTPTPFLWKQIFIDHKKWVGEYMYQGSSYHFQFSVQSVQLDNNGEILGVISEDHGSKFDVKGYKEAEDIVFQIEAIHQGSPRFPDTQWYVRGHLQNSLCSWKYEGKISSMTQGFSTLTMESDIEEKMLNDPLCVHDRQVTLVVVGVCVAIVMVVLVALVAYYCTKRKGGFRSSGHRSLTSFENPVYEYEHSLK